MSSHYLHKLTPPRPGSGMATMELYPIPHAVVRLPT